MSLYKSLLAIAIFCILHIVFAQRCPAEETVPLHSVQTLTLYRDGRTTGLPGKRPIPQIQSMNRMYEDKLPPVLQCTNVGLNDRREVQWKCKGDLPRGYSMGEVHISCIDCGYDRRTDGPLVLQGSCGASVEIIEHGQRHSSYRSRRSSRSHQRNAYEPIDSTTDGDSGSGVFIVVIIVIAIIVIMIALSKRDQAPYDPNIPSAPREEDLYVRPPRYEYSRDRVQSDSGPGFWTGAAVGAAGGYAMGRASRSSSPSYSSYSSYSSSRYHRDDSDEDTHESTGYGGTSLR